MLRMASFEQARLNFDDGYVDKIPDNHQIINNARESDESLLGLLISRSIYEELNLFEDFLS